MGETSGETLIFTCAGAAHCGQVANRTAVQLTADGAACAWSSTAAATTACG
jgi:uncharacterized metal-binding protein